MKKSVLIMLSAVLLLSGCAKEFNRVYKSDNYAYKYEYAKECFARGKYTRAISLLEGMVTMLKGSQNGQESLYMLAMAEYNSKDYETAAEYFKKYYSSYPRGDYAELAKFYIGQSLYMSTPEPRLDQSQTLSAISAFQEYLDVYPLASEKEMAQSRLFSLQDKLVRKELYSAQLYYDLGNYFGNCNAGGESNFLACIITAQNALKDYPYSSLREDFSVLLMKSKFELAENSIEAKRLERYQDAEDECYGFINEFPDSKSKSLAERFIQKCKKVTKSQTGDSTEESESNN
ncbi:MAG: outer membrane protein assembly factor BamD [Prevotella sp.]|nr:outer membrane protein assembly factor BamD [Prevotella sp.]